MNYELIPYGKAKHYLKSEESEHFLFTAAAMYETGDYYEIYEDDYGQNFCIAYEQDGGIEEIECSTYNYYVDTLEYLHKKYCKEKFLNDEKWLHKFYPWLTSEDLCEIPEGWLNSFILDWANEVNEEYKKMIVYNQKEFKVIQLKEKYGSFRQYFNFCTPTIIEICRKYENLSEHTCIICGRPAEFMSVGWIEPLCGQCAKTVNTELYPIEREDEE